MKLKTLGSATALCAGLLLGAPVAMASDLNEPPQRVVNTLQDGQRMGQGTLRWFGLRVYDGQLWANTDPQSFNYKRDPAWLELKYARNFKGEDIAKRSIEEIENIGAGTAELRTQWLDELIAVFPDVQKGDTLSALHTPGQGIQFFRNGEPHKTLSNAALAEAFMGIWLDPKTSAPEMRRQLIGLKR